MKNTLGSRIRGLRNSKKLSQKEFGKLFNLAESTIGMYERGERKPDYETLQVIASHFSTTREYLLSGNSDKNKSNQDSKLPELTPKDEHDIAKRMEKMKKDLIEGSADGEDLTYKGEPISEEAIESLLEALEHAERITTLANKKYIPKKYRG